MHTVAFTDVDSGQSHTFAITGGNTGGAFAIDPTTGAITVAEQRGGRLRDDAQLRPHGPGDRRRYAPASGTATITVNLTDTGEPPAVDAATFTVAENAAAATAVGTVTFTDPDVGQAHTFAITAGNTGGAFAIDPATGAITVALPLDFETTPSYSLTVEVTDDGTPALSGTATITVNVTNVNESPSIIAPATIAVQRDVPQVLAGISVADPDAGDIELTLAVDDGTLAIDETASAADVTGDGTATVVITGTVAEINAILGDADGVTYLNDVGFLERERHAARRRGRPRHADTDGEHHGHAPVQPAAGRRRRGRDDRRGHAGRGDALRHRRRRRRPHLRHRHGADERHASAPSARPTAPPSSTPAPPAVTYTPNGDFNGADQFTYEADDGVSTDTGTVSITVNAVNDAPSFTKGADQTVLEDSGAQTVNGWATAISAGPADESGQTVSFTITNNTNAALFSVAPAVASNGTLSYTPAANAIGAATITLKAVDNGTPARRERDRRRSTSPSHR